MNPTVAMTQSVIVVHAQSADGNPKRLNNTQIEHKPKLTAGADLS